jgi:hypothetical protein
MGAAGVVPEAGRVWAFGHGHSGLQGLSRGRRRPEDERRGSAGSTDSTSSRQAGSRQATPPYISGCIAPARRTGAVEGGRSPTAIRPRSFAEFWERGRVRRTVRLPWAIPKPNQPRYLGCYFLAVPLAHAPAVARQAMAGQDGYEDPDGCFALLSMTEFCWVSFIGRSRQIARLSTERTIAGGDTSALLGRNVGARTCPQDRPLALGDPQAKPASLPRLLLSEAAPLGGFHRNPPLR